MDKDLTKHEDKNEASDVPVTAPAQDARAAGRRRFLKIGLGVAAVPVVLTVKSRPSWAGTCGSSPSIDASVAAGGSCNP